MTSYTPGAYNTCLHCEHLGNGCDGPNTLSMTIERWCQWCHDLKVIRGYTNHDISEKSGVSITTVNRIMAGMAPKDIKRATASDINRVLVGSEGQWPCAMMADSLTVQNEKLETMREDYQLKIQHLKEEIEHLKEESARKDKIINKLMGIS